MTHLHVFALNEPLSVSHTNLTRQKGETPELPPLVEWLGVEGLDTDEIELFPLENLGAMSLSDYIQLAFAPEDSIPAEVRRRLDALTGSVLLVPDDAVTGALRPGPQATQIAEVALAEADHGGTLPKADTRPAPREGAEPEVDEPARENVPPIALFALIGMAILAAIIVIFGWG